MDAKTGEVYALANDKSFDPNNRGYDTDAMGNPAVTTPFEPGSVNKVVTAAGGDRRTASRPRWPCIDVPARIQIADRRCTTPGRTARRR